MGKADLKRLDTFQFYLHNTLEMTSYGDGEDILSCQGTEVEVAVTNKQQEKSVSVLLDLYLGSIVVTEIYTQDKIARSNVHTLVTARQNRLKTEQSLQSAEQFCTNIHFLVLILYCRSNDDMSPLGK